MTAHFSSKEQFPLDRILNRPTGLRSRSKVVKTASSKGKATAQMYMDITQRLRNLNLLDVAVKLDMDAHIFGRTGAADIVLSDASGMVICVVDYCNLFDGRIHGQAAKHLAYAQMVAQQQEYALVLCAGMDDASSAANRASSIVEHWAEGMGAMIDTPPDQVQGQTRKDWVANKIPPADKAKIRKAIDKGTYYDDYGYLDAESEKLVVDGM